MQQQDWAKIKLISKFLPILCVALLACGGDDDGGSDKDPDAGKDSGIDSGPVGGSGGSDGSVNGTNECRSASQNDCDEHATCTDTPKGYDCECDGPAYEGDGKSCECADGYTEVDGACVADNGAECSDDDQCENGHCVDGICCASACDDPGTCQAADGASCSDGETCEYAAADDGSECDDGNACTDGDSCNDGECAGDEIECDDDNVCTADSCDPEEGCVFDGTDITDDCQEDDACGTHYVCQGNVRGDCLPADPVICDPAPDACTKPVCDGETGCGFAPRAEGEECEDGDACTEGEVCTGGDCGGGEAIVCDDHNVCTDDACNPASGCVVGDFNSNACDDDNECTTIDTCQGGNCLGGSPVVCTALDQCHMAGTCDPGTGDCSDPNKPDTSSCNDNMPCTTQDQCTAGACAGSGNACGDECNPSPCHQNASCNDPSSTPGNVECTCNTGYMGNGMTCTDINECAGNPCGASRGTCTQGDPGTYTCDCMTGFRSVDTATGPTCVCDMGGTFAFRTDSTVSWPAAFVGPFEVLEAGGGTSVSWGIRTQTYGADGILHTVVRACGGVAPDICDSPNSILNPKRAYNQYEPNSFYDQNIASNEPDLALPNPLPGSRFVTALTAALTGIDLTNDYGTWPATRQNVSPGTGTQTNGATWTAYTPGVYGVTTLIVPPGGVSDDNSGDDDPPVTFGVTSSACPRSRPQDARYPYGYLPNPTGSGEAIISVRSGGRLQSWLDGNFDNNCNRITGTVKGPAADDEPLYEGRFQGCTTTSGATCSNGAVNALDTQPQTQEISAVTFVMERATAGLTCDEARAWNYAP